MALRILSARVPGHRIVLHLRILLLALLVGAGARKYNLRTVPGFSELMSCASAALTYEVAVPPFDNCPSDAAPKSFATCMCDNRCYGQATSEINGWHDKFCSTVSPFNAVSVFRNFCSVNNGLLDPVATAVPTSDGGAITAPTASPGSTRVSNFPTPTSGAFPSSSNTPPASSSSSGLSTAAKAGIVVGIVVVVGVVLLTLCYYCGCRRNSTGRSHLGFRVRDNRTNSRVTQWDDERETQL